MADRSSWTPGMHLYYVYYKACGYGESSAEDAGESLRGASSSNTWVKFAELLRTEGFGGSAVQGSSNHALFGTPIDTSRPNLERIHALVLAAGQDSGQRDHKPGAYNPQAVTMYALRNRDGTYLTLAGHTTHDPLEARCFYTQEEALAVKKPTHQIVEI